MPVRTAPASLSSADANLRAAYVREVLDLLYPGADPGGGTEFLMIPDRRRPRLLVPSADRRIAAAAVARYAEPQSRLARVKRDAVVMALRSGASSALLRDRVRANNGTDTIETYLRQVLGTDLYLSVHIGPARANRKPIVQVLAADGTTLAFVKLGTNELTRRLVRDEAAALRTLGATTLRAVRVPDLLHTGTWRRHEVLVQCALPVWEPRVALASDGCAEAMREVALSCGITRARLAGSAYWATLGTRLAAVTEHPEGHQLSRAARRIGTAAGDVGLEFGSWHGDWAPWNMRPVAGELLVWDWERFTTGVPMGFDALHYDLQQRISTQSDGTAAVRQTLLAASSLLAPFGVTAPSAVRLTALLYLIDLAARYLADRQAEAGARLGVLGRWLLPVLLSTVEDL
ncbi:hypothetical protein Val02_16770 [Virgisporangium aliadipatigenens]|uniref:Aminoglycoside phosphotransferase domain-containing protein n=1 Tax=Virgisporangium aliadipatigenens TaxID=741659 RepID=A0A8J3YGS3_9ACTN|nr:hypothetical protein [Virgisporangium aliadipatigenens]GIJ44791.1 hypothetical protein Val02_16770 [Virgisporangium aliadipatigenens]